MVVSLSVIAPVFIFSALNIASQPAAAIKICNQEPNSYSQIERGYFTGVHDVIARLYGKIGVAECALSCHTEQECNTASYDPDGVCLLLRNFYSQMNVTQISLNSLHISEIVPIRDMVDKCSPACMLPSVCIYDCTNESSLVPICVDESASYCANGCDYLLAIQSKEYYLKNFNQEASNSGFDLFAVNFIKLNISSSLKVLFRGVLSSVYGGCANGWAKWEITFNGSSCSSPGPIEAINSNYEVDLHHHKSTGIQGICYNLPPGNASISLRTAILSCGAYLRVGFASHGTRLFVEEIFRAPLTKETPMRTCPSLSIFNSHQHTTTEEWDDDAGANLWVSRLEGTSIRA